MSFYVGNRQKELNGFNSFNQYCDLFQLNSPTFSRVGFLLVLVLNTNF